METSRRLTQLAGAIILAAATLAATTTHTNQVSDTRKKGGFICDMLGTDEPFSFLKDPMSREIVDYDVNMCDTTVKSLSVKLVFKQLAVAARLPELQQGHVDLLAASFTHNRGHKARIDFLISMFITGQKAMVKKSNDITSLAQLDGRKLLMIRGSIIEANVAKTIKNTSVALFNNNPQALLALQQGGGVAYMSDETTLIGNMAEMGLAARDYVLLPQSLSTEHLALGIRKGEPTLEKQVDDVLLGIEKSGEAQKLLDKWSGPNTKMTLPQRTFKISTDKVN